MKDFMVIARVGGVDYLTKVSANRNAGAEHEVLDKGICTRYGYGVTSCIAFDADTMKTDTFIGAALGAQPIAFDDLCKIIDEVNAKLAAKDAAERRLKEIEKQIEALRAEAANCEDILAQ